MEKIENSIDILQSEVEILHYYQYQQINYYRSKLNISYFIVGFLFEFLLCFFWSLFRQKCKLRFIVISYTLHKSACKICYQCCAYYKEHVSYAAEKIESIAGSKQHRPLKTLGYDIIYSCYKHQKA